MNKLSVFSRRGAVVVCIMLSGCVAGPSGAAGDPASDRAYGAFLAARYADSQHNPAVATQYYTQALRLEPNNPQLAAEGFLAALLAGSQQAQTLAAQVPDNALAAMLRGNQAALDGDYAAAGHIYASLPQDDLIGLIKPLLLAWAEFGSGNAQRALAGLEPYFGTGVFSPIYVLNAALMADAAHDDTDAARLYAQAAKGPTNLRLAEVLASWHTRQNQPEQAARDLAVLLAAHPDLQIALPQLQAQLDKPVIHTPEQGLAEAYLTLAGSLNQPSQAFLRTTLLRFALMLRPDLTAARLLLANAQLGSGARAAPTPIQMQNALATLQPVPPDDPLYGPSAVQQASLLAALNRPDEAAALLDKLITMNPNDPDLMANAGDVWRNANQPAKALPYYNRALAALGQPVPASAWALYFDRGICEDQLGDWAAAEPDIKQALALSPNQPYVLNYLGYSWALHGEHLDQAQAMLQQAISLDPNDGAVLDSLGYIDLRRGHTRQAVALLTQAVELDPDDAEVNAHLGDAFWQDHQALQADFQWQRALTLKPGAKLKAEIAGKLQKHFPAN